METSQTEQPALGTCTTHFQDHTITVPLGDLGTLEPDQSGEEFYSGKKEKLKVADLIGRAVVVYKKEDNKSGMGLTAEVIARSAGVGENYKKLCICDGTVIWEATNNDFLTNFQLTSSNNFHSLSYVYQRSTTAISIVAPICYVLGSWTNGHCDYI